MPATAAIARSMSWRARPSPLSIASVSRTLSRLRIRLARRIRRRLKVRDTDAIDSGDGRARHDIERAIAAVAGMGEGAELSDAQVADLACGLTDLTVRDTM